MPVIQLEAQLSADQLLRAVEQLPPPEFDRFLAGAMRLRASKPRASQPPRRELELLAQATAQLPPGALENCRNLRDKQRVGKLSEAEHTEFLALIKEIEGRNVKRIGALAELAQMRQQPLTAVMDELGIAPPDYE